MIPSKVEPSRPSAEAKSIPEFAAAYSTTFVASFSSIQHSEADRRLSCKHEISALHRRFNCMISFQPAVGLGLLSATLAFASLGYYNDSETGNKAGHSAGRRPTFRWFDEDALQLPAFH